MEKQKPIWHDDPKNPWEVIESIMSLGYNVHAVIHQKDNPLVLNDRS